MSLVRDLIRKYPGLRRAAGRLVAATPYSLRLGKQFWYWYSLYRESEGWSVEQMKAFQLDCLRALLKQLSVESEFYQRRLSGVDIDKIDSVARFASQVPTLTRQEFADNQLSIFSKQHPTRKLSLSKTSGTTGSALKFYHTVDDDRREWATLCHQWSRVGYDPVKSRRAEFRGLVSSRGRVDVFPDRNMISCSILYLDERHVRRYADAIRTHRIDFLHGYPSALHLLSRTITDCGMDFPQPKGILLASGPVYQWQLDTIQKTFPDARLYAHYGCAERTVMAGWCEHRREYHVMPHYSIVEVDPVNNEVIGTNLFNTVNGFVRYRMTDTVLDFDDAPCPDCGRPYVPRIVNLGGRTGHYLFSPENGWIAPALVTYPLHCARTIRQAQFVQPERDSITLRYVAPETADIEAIKRDLTGIEDGMRRLLGATTGLSFERVDEFPRSASGKFKWIVSELDEARFNSEAT